MDQEELKAHQAMLQAMSKLTESLVDTSRMMSSGGMSGPAAGPSSSRSGAVGNRNKRMMDEELRKNYEGLRNWGKGQRAINKLLPKLISLQRTTAEEQSEYNKVLSEYNERLAEGANHLSDLSDEVDKLRGQGVFRQQRALAILTKKTNSFTSQLAQNQRVSSLFNAALIESHSRIEEGTFEYEKFMEDMGKAAATLDKSILKKAKLVDEETGKLREDLTDADFSRLSQIMGQAQTSITESLSGLKDIGISTFAQLSAAHERVSAGAQIHTDANGNPLTNLTSEQKAGNKLSAADGSAMTRLNAGLTKMVGDLLIQGVDLGEEFTKIGVKGEVTADQLSQLNTLVSSQNDGGTVLIKRLKELDVSLATSTKNIAKEARARNDEFAMMMTRISAPVAFAKDKLVEALSAFSLGASLKNLGDKLGVLATQVTAFNIAQVPATFWAVNKAAMSMGMNFDDTVKYMQANKRTMALYGDSFPALTDQVQKTFSDFGYNMSQAASMFAPTMENAIVAGIDTKDPLAVKGFIENSMNSFSKLSAIVDITGEDFAKLDTAMLNQQEVSEKLLGLDRDKALAYVKELQNLRQHYVEVGLSTEQAQQLIAIQQKQQREPVVAKMKEAAKGLMYGRQMGLSDEEAQRQFALNMNGNRNSDQEDELLALNTKLETNRAKKRQDAWGPNGENFAGGTQFDIIDQQLRPGGAQGEALTAAQKAALTAKANNGVTPGDTKAQQAKTKPSQTVAELSQAANQLTTIFTSALGAAALAAATTLGMLALSSGKLNLAMGGKGLLGAGKSLLENGLLGTLQNMFKGTGGIAGGALPTITGSGEALAGGAAAASGTAVGAGEAAVAGGGALAGAKAIGGKYLASKGGLAGMGTGLLKGGGVAAGGMLLDAGGEALTANGHERLGGLASVGGSAAKWAGYGMMAGSVIPGLGTGVGALAGGAIGAGIGLYDHAGDIFHGNPADTPSNTSISTAIPYTAPGTNSSKSDVNKQSSTSSSESGILNVADQDAKTQLMTIADSMATMVKLLQSISTEGLKATVDLPVGQNGTIGNNRKIASAYEYQTGKKTT
jgi:hypothetical protein